jgi:hypothetical protein
MVLVARDNTALPALSIVGWFSQPPWLEYAGGLVAPTACHLALVAARAPLVAMYGDAQNSNKLPTIPNGPGVVELAGLWPRCDMPALPPHDGRSDSLGLLDRYVIVCVFFSRGGYKILNCGTYWISHHISGGHLYDLP